MKNRKQGRLSRAPRTEENRTDADLILDKDIQRLKKETCGALLLFELGTYLAAYDDDATAIGALLGILVPYPPHWRRCITLVRGQQLDKTIQRIIANGFRVSICAPMQ